MDEIRGIITRIFKRDAENGYIYADIQYEDSFNLAKAKISGYNKELDTDHYFTARGAWTSVPARNGYPAYRLFKSKVIQPDLPTNKEGAIKWLSAMFKADEHGATASQIRAFVDNLGPTAAHKCEANPELLIGVSTKPNLFRNAILKTWSRAVSGRKAFKLMADAGVDDRTAKSIQDAFLSRTYEVVSRNPYQAARVKNVGFKTADKIGRHVNIGAKDDRRVAAALVEALNTYRTEGSTYARLNDITSRMDTTYGIDTATAADYMIRAEASPDAAFVLDEENGKLFTMLRELGEGEEIIAERVVEMLVSGRRNRREKVDEVARQLFATDKYSKFDDIQRAAVAMALTEPFSILTGGPGTGKSTVSEVIVAGARILDAKDILLCAPTGKAAKRLEETTKIKAQTIHRLLGAKHDPTTDGTVFDRSAKNPLPSGCIVLVDEASMIDIPTMRGLVEAMPKDGRLILVGDRNQLPSVDAGAVLGDLINAKNSRGELFVPSTELVNVYRQSRNSSIAKGAAEIRQGRLPIMSRQPVGGLVFYEEAQDNLVKSILAFVKNVCIDKLKLNPHQFAILCPQTKGTAGTWQLNRELSNILNPKGRQIPGVFRAADDDVEMPIQRVGDRVMLKENDNENDIMNGEIGTIIDAGIMKLKGADRQCMVIRFGDAKAPDSFRDVIYPAAFWRNFILAYAITIHKSQGSQFYTVIMPQTMAHSSMLDRSLLYTGWTRATDLLCIFGETEALELAVSCTDASARNTRLPAYIHDKATEAGLRGRPAPPEPARKPPVAETPRPVTPVAPAPRPSTASAPAHRPASPASRPVPGRGRPPSFSHSNQAATSPSSEPSAARPSKPRGRPASFKPPVDEDTTPDAPSM